MKAECKSGNLEAQCAITWRETSMVQKQAGKQAINSILLARGHYYCSIRWQTKPNVSPVRKINLLIIFKYATRWEANFCWMRGKYAGQSGIYELLVKEGSNQNLPFRGKLVYLQSRYLIICLRSKVCDNDDLGCLLGSLLERRFCFFGRLRTWQFK